MSTSTESTGKTPSPGRDFGDYLRSSREERNVHLTEVARQTRIPVRSLERLEAGEFDKLPADIFVRGFLRSYAECVGLEQTDILDRYTELGRRPPALATDLLTAARASRASRDDATLLPAPGAPEENDKRRRTILPELSDSEREPRRGPVTVAVIILVIITTLAMSYLLRRPSADSDGFTKIEPASSDSTQHIV